MREGSILRERVGGRRERERKRERGHWEEMEERMAENGIRLSRGRWECLNKRGISRE